MTKIKAKAKTIKLADQLKASAAMYERELQRIEDMSDTELLNLFASAGTVDRVLGIASAGTVARVLGIASDGTVARVLGLASAGTVARVLGIASDGTVDRVLGIASDGTVARVLGIASAGTVDRVLGIASAGTVARVLGLASDGTVDRVLGIASDGTVDRLNMEVPIVENLDERMYEVTKEGHLDMSNWHCGTTHCRAGWAITFAGEAGAALEEAIGPNAAGRYIYEASTGRPAPDFFASTSVATADIARCAGVAA